MTTIISNGYYLTADHRQCVSNPDCTFISRTTGKRTAEYVNDDVIKINLVDSTVQLRGGGGDRILAFAVAGNAEIEAPFLELLENSGRSTLPDWRHVLDAMSFSISSAATIVLITDAFVTEVLSFPKNDPETRWMLQQYPPGQVVAFGIGAVALNEMMSEKGSYSPTFDGGMAIASQDEYTSKSYSAYGAREGILFANVEPSSSHLACLISEEIRRFNHLRNEHGFI